MIGSAAGQQFARTAHIDVDCVGAQIADIDASRAGQIQIGVAAALQGLGIDVARAVQLQVQGADAARQAALARTVLAEGERAAVKVVDHQAPGTGRHDLVELRRGVGDAHPVLAVVAAVDPHLERAAATFSAHQRQHIAVGLDLQRRLVADPHIHLHRTVYLKAGQRADRAPLRGDLAVADHDFLAEGRGQAHVFAGRDDDGAAGQGGEAGEREQSAHGRDLYRYKK